MPLNSTRHATVALYAEASQACRRVEQPSAPRRREPSAESSWCVTAARYCRLAARALSFPNRLPQPAGENWRDVMIDESEDYQVLRCTSPAAVR
jgi:hypothetical protein